MYLRIFVGREPHISVCHFHISLIKFINISRTMRANDSMFYNTKTCPTKALLKNTKRANANMYYFPLPFEWLHG